MLTINLSEGKNCTKYHSDYNYDIIRDGIIIESGEIEGVENRTGHAGIITSLQREVSVKDMEKRFCIKLKR